MYACMYAVGMYAGMHVCVLSTHYVVDPEKNPLR